MNDEIIKNGNRINMGNDLFSKELWVIYLVTSPSPIMVYKGSCSIWKAKRSIVSNAIADQMRSIALDSIGHLALQIEQLATHIYQNQWR